MTISVYINVIWKWAPFLIWSSNSSSHFLSNLNFKKILPKCAFFMGLMLQVFAKAVKGHSQWIGNDVGLAVMLSIFGNLSDWNKDQGPGSSFALVTAAVSGLACLSVWPLLSFLLLNPQEFLWELPLPWIQSSTILMIPRGPSIFPLNLLA